MDKQSSKRLATIAVEVFDQQDAGQLREWLAMRRRILDPASRPRAALAALKTNRENVSRASTFTLFGANGRAIASSTELFGDSQSAERGAATIMERADTLTIKLVTGTPTPALAWLICVDGMPKVMPLRYYNTVRSRDLNAAGALATLRSGFLVPVGATLVQDPVEPKRQRVDGGPIVEASVAKSIKVRGEPRPIRPIASRDAYFHRLRERPLR